VNSVPDEDPCVEEWLTRRRTFDDKTSWCRGTKRKWGPTTLFADRFQKSGAVMSVLNRIKGAFEPLIRRVPGRRNTSSQPALDIKGKGKAGAQMADMPLNMFLRERKDAFLKALAMNKAEAGAWTVVMGNEAGGAPGLNIRNNSDASTSTDLDSIASAIGYAFLSSDSKIVPLIQSQRDSLHLRPENMDAFQVASLDPSFLLTSSDLPPPPAPQPSRFALVDHNRLLPSFNGEVVGIIDHHEDESLHTTANPRIIEPVGSCASLVTLQFRSILESGSTEQFKDIASLLISAILIDTGALKPKGKAVEEDYQAAQLLMPLTGMATDAESISGDGSHIPAPLQLYFEALSLAKGRVGHLSTRDLLRRDYKEYDYSTGTRCGLATVPIKLETWHERDADEFWEGVDAWMEERKLHVLGMLTTYKSAKKGKGRRQSVWVVRGLGEELDRLADGLFKGIEKSELQVEDIGKLKGQKKRRVRAYQHKNTKPTRKAVAPLVQKIIEGSKKESPSTAR
jgi:exopolyphosphatase